MQDADFVINTASVVSHDEAIGRRAIGEKHGYYYGRVNVGEYNYRNMRFMLDVAHEMEQVCPDAWLIQSGNPVFEGCTLMTRETSIKVCGLCHGHYGYRDICDMIGIDWRKRHLAGARPEPQHLDDPLYLRGPGCLPLAG